MHAGFADGPFLYGMHYLPLLIIVAAYGCHSRFRPIILPALVALAAIAAVHNLDVRARAVADLDQNLAPRFQTHGR